MRTLNRLGDETILKTMIALRDMLLIKPCEYRREPRPTLPGKQRDRTVQTPRQRSTAVSVAASGAPIATRVVEGQAATRARQPGAAAVRKSRSPRVLNERKNPPTAATRARWDAFDLIGQFR